MRRKSVLIVGGGISGLVAARELARNKIRVTLLEAQDRFGGRIHTIRDGKLPVELGAEFLHGRNESMIQILRDAKLSTRAISAENKILADNRFEKIDLLEIVGNVFKQISPHGHDCSFDEFIAGQDLDEWEKELARNFVQGFDAADPQHISAHALLRADFSSEHMKDPRQSRIIKGYSALVRFFERELHALGCKLMTQTTARHIKWRQKHVDVLAEYDNHLVNFEADALIVALPLGVLKTCSVSIDPFIPEKQEAIHDLLVGNVIKIIFHFREPFWGDGGFFHAFDEMIPTWWSDPRNPFLTGWAGGPRANPLMILSTAQLKSLGLKILGKIFSDSPEKLRKQLVEMHYWNWTNDVHIRGAYSYIPVGGLNLPKQLAASVADTLFFAGEATVSDAQTGTVGGALDSGLRAARELLNVH